MEKIVKSCQKVYVWLSSNQSLYYLYFWPFFTQSNSILICLNSNILPSNQSSDLVLIYPSKLNSYFFWWYQFNLKTLTFLLKNEIILHFSPSRELGTVQHKIELTVLKWLYRRFWRHVAKQYGFPEVKKPCYII